MDSKADYHNPFIGIIVNYSATIGLCSTILGTSLHFMKNADPHRQKWILFLTFVLMCPFTTGIFSFVAKFFIRWRDEYENDSLGTGCAFLGYAIFVSPFYVAMAFGAIPVMKSWG